MTIDLLVILKAIWGFATFTLFGLLKIVWSDYKKMQVQVDNLEKDFIKLKSESVTKDQLDEVLERKVRPLQTNIQELKDNFAGFRKDIKDDLKEDMRGLRDDIRDIISKRN